MASRDRDATGRARNARPRDALGRPLPHGAEGVPRIPEDLVLAPEPSLREAQRLFEEGLPFHAHEILEGAWKAAPEAERDLWQGLAQLAVGLTHLRRGNPSGARTLLRRARARIARYATDPPYRVDVDGLLAWADERLAALGDGVTETDPAAPRLVTGDPSVTSSPQAPRRGRRPGHPAAAPGRPTDPASRPST